MRRHSRCSTKHSTRPAGRRSQPDREITRPARAARVLPQRPPARRLLEESIVEARAIDDRWCLADALGTLGSILPLVGELELAEKVSSEALAIARDAQDEQGIRMALFGIALTASRQDDLATLRDAAEEGLEICRSIGDAWFISYFLWLLAVASVQLGELEIARAQADESLAVARLLEAPLLIVCALEAVAAVDRAAGDTTSASAALEEARNLARAGDVPGAYLSSVTRALGELAAEAGHADEAATLLTEAADVARAVGDSWGLARAVATLDRAVDDLNAGLEETGSGRALRHHGRVDVGQEDGLGAGPAGEHLAQRIDDAAVAGVRRGRRPRRPG